MQFRGAGQQEDRDTSRPRAWRRGLVQWEGVVPVVRTETYLIMLY